MPVMARWIVALSVPALLLSYFGDLVFGITSMANAIYQRVLLVALAGPLFLVALCPQQQVVEQPSDQPSDKQENYDSYDRTIKMLLTQNAQLHYENKKLQLKHSKLTLLQSQSWHAGLTPALDK